MGQKLRAIRQPLPLAKLAYDRLRDSILSGVLKPGEIYNETKLAKDFGISRTPVREALLELSVQGLVTFLPRRGVRINHFTKHDVEEVFELRKAIELAVVEKVSRCFKEIDLTKLGKTLDNQLQAIKKGDRVAFLEADRVFHTTLARLTQNQRLVSTLENIRDMVEMMAVEALTRPGRMEEVIEEHRNVLRFIQQMRGPEARQAMDYHLDRSEDAVLEQQDRKVEDVQTKPKNNSMKKERSFKERAEVSSHAKGA